MKKKIINKIAQLNKVVIPAVLLFGLFVLASFVEGQHKMQECKSHVINIKGGDKFKFVTEEEILNLVNPNHTDITTGKMIKDINLADIEGKLRQNQFVKGAEASLDMNGQLNIDITQREPVIRVVNPMGQEYYIDKNQKRMPLSEHYTAKVPIATTEHCSAYTNDSLLKELDDNLFYLAGIIKNDNYIQSLAGQLVIHDNFEFSIIPRLGKFEIQLGDTSDIKDKFARLKVFYKSSLPQVGWNAYSLISLKYKNQIIANKAINNIKKTPNIIDIPKPVNVQLAAK